MLFNPKARTETPEAEEKDKNEETRPGVYMKVPRFSVRKGEGSRNLAFLLMLHSACKIVGSSFQ
jgi:hypothetical protein